MSSPTEHSNCADWLGPRPISKEELEYHRQNSLTPPYPPIDLEADRLAVEKLLKEHREHQL